MNVPFEKLLYQHVHRHREIAQKSISAAFVMVGTERVSEEEIF